MVRIVPAIVVIVLLLQLAPAAFPGVSEEDGAGGEVVANNSGPAARAWAPWWNGNWSYRMPITINNSINAFPLTEFQVPINLTWTNGMSADYGDIRFVQWLETSSQNLVLPYWLYSSNSTMACTWVNVSLVPAWGEAKVYVYYGNPTATNASDPNNTMVMYDNFDDNTINTTQWITTAQNGGAIAETGGEMVTSGDSDWWGANFYNRKFIPFGAYFISLSARHPTVYGSGSSPTGQFFLTDRDNVTWGIDPYQTPNPLVVLVNSMNGGTGTFDCDIEVTIYGITSSTTDYSSTTKRGTCSGANIARTNQNTLWGSIGTLAFDFNGESYQNHPTYWDDVVIRKFVENLPDIFIGTPEVNFRFDKFGMDPENPKNNTLVFVYAIVTNPNSIPINVDFIIKEGNSYETGETLLGMTYWFMATETFNMSAPWVTSPGYHHFWLGLNYHVVANFTVKVNYPPHLIRPGKLLATEDEPFNFTINVDDADGEVHYWSVTNTRFKAHVLTNLSANISFLGDNNDTAIPVFFRVIVSDPSGDEDYLDLNVTVRNVNDPPFIGIKKFMPATEEEPYETIFVGIDPDINDKLAWSYETNCSWLGFGLDKDNLTLSGVPPNEAGGMICWVRLVVTDILGLNGTFLFNISVNNINDDPFFTTLPEIDLFPLMPWEYRIGVMDFDAMDVLTVGPGHTPLGMRFDANENVLYWTPPQDSRADYSVVLFVDDGTTRVYQNFTLYVYPKTSYEPLVTLIGPENGSVVDTIRPAFAWSVLDPDSVWVTYDIFLSESRDKVDNFDLDALYYSYYEGTVFMPDPLVKGRTYYWTVVPNDGANTGRCLNGTWSFTVGTKAEEDNRPMASQVAPVDNAYIFKLPMMMVWNGVDPAGMDILYDVYLSTDKDAVKARSDASKVETGTGSNSRFMETMKPGIYYWTVIPFNIITEGDCLGGIWSFEVPSDAGVNHPPRISSSPPASATVNLGYEWAFDVSDEDNEFTSCRVTMAPDNMSFTTGMRSNEVMYQIEWFPSLGQLGLNTVVLQISDGTFVVDFEFTINVSLPPDYNKKPEITSKPETSARVGDRYVYVLKAKDPDILDDLRSKLVVAPDGMDMDSDGVVTWTPRAAQEGKHNVSISVTDGKDTVYQNFTIDVAAKPSTPGPGETITKLDPMLLALFGALILGVLLLAAFLVASGRKKRKALEEKHKAEKAEWQKARKEMAAVEKAGLAMGVEPIVAGAGAGAAAGAAVLGGDEGVEAFDITDLYLIYNDGRLMAHMSTHADNRMDKDIMTSMLMAIQSFVRDSFQEGLTSFETGESRVVLVGGQHVILAGVIKGTEPKVLRDEMADAVAKIEGMYAGMVEHWDGKIEHFQDVQMFMSPIFRLCTSLKQKTKERKVSLKSGVEFYMGYVRLKLALSNELREPITNITVTLEYDHQTLKLSHLKPDYPISDRSIFLPDVLPMEKRTVAVHFDPIICQESHMDAIAVYTDGTGVQNTVRMKTRPVDIVCPIFYTRENVNVAMLKRLLGEMGYKDSRVFGISDTGSLKRVYGLANEAVKGHDIKFVREFVENEPWKAESWFYGEVQDTEERLVIKVAADASSEYIEVFVASSNLASMTGLLAELSSDVMGKVKGADLKGEELKVCMDEKFTDEVKRTQMLLEKYADAEIEAEGTELKQK